MCEHIVKVENATKLIEGSGKVDGGKRDRHGGSTEKGSPKGSPTKGSPTTTTTASRRIGTSNRIDDPGECKALLYERNEFQGRTASTSGNKEYEQHF